MRSVRVVIQKPYVYAEVYQNGRLISTGFSKCNPTDQWHTKTGIRIAVGRAVKRYDRGKMPLSKEITFDLNQITKDELKISNMRMNMIWVHATPGVENELEMDIANI